MRKNIWGDTGGVLADDALEAEDVGLRFKVFPGSGVPLGK